MAGTRKKASSTAPKKKTGKATHKRRVIEGSVRSDARVAPKNLSDAEMQKGITYGIRKIAATQRRSRRTQEEIVRLRKKSRALLEKL